MAQIDAKKTVREFRAIRAKTKGKVSEATANEIAHRAKKENRVPIRELFGIMKTRNFWKKFHKKKWQ